MTILSKINTIIIHVPKTGGSSVRWSAISKYGARYSCQHCNFNMIPSQYKNFRKITFTRNPIDWYASRFFFDKKKFDLSNKQSKLEPFSDALSEQYNLTFEQTLPRMLNLTEAFRNGATLELFKERLRFEVLNNYQCWWVSYFDDIENITADSFENKSLYQWFNDIVGLDKCDVVYRLEDQYEYGMKLEFGSDIKLAHRNSTGREKSEDIYTTQMRQSVLKTEKDFIRKYYGKFEN